MVNNQNWLTAVANIPLEVWQIIAEDPNLGVQDHVSLSETTHKLRDAAADALANDKLINHVNKIADSDDPDASLKILNLLETKILGQRQKFAAQFLSAILSAVSGFQDQAEIINIATDYIENIEPKYRVEPIIALTASIEDLTSPGEYQKYWQRSLELSKSVPVEHLHLILDLLSGKTHNLDDQLYGQTEIVNQSKRLIANLHSRQLANSANEIQYLDEDDRFHLYSMIIDEIEKKFSQGNEFLDPEDIDSFNSSAMAIKYIDENRRTEAYNHALSVIRSSTIRDLTKCMDSLIIQIEHVEDQEQVNFFMIL